MLTKFRKFLFSRFIIRYKLGHGKNKKASRKDAENVQINISNYDLSDMGSIDSNIFKNSLHTMLENNYDTKGSNKFISLADVHYEKNEQNEIVRSGHSIISYNSIYLSSESDQQTIFTENPEFFESLRFQTVDPYLKNSDSQLSTEADQHPNYPCFEDISNNLGQNIGGELEVPKSSRKIIETKYSSLPDFESSKLLSDYEIIDEKLRNTDKVSGNSFQIIDKKQNHNGESRDSLADDDRDVVIASNINSYCFRQEVYEKDLSKNISKSLGNIENRQNEIDERKSIKTSIIDAKTSSSQQLPAFYIPFETQKNTVRSGKHVHTDFVLKSCQLNGLVKLNHSEKDTHLSNNIHNDIDCEASHISNLTGKSKSKLPRKSSSFKMLRSMTTRPAEHVLQKSYSTEQLYENEKCFEKTYEEFLNKVNSVKTYWSNIFHNEDEKFTEDSACKDKLHDTLMPKEEIPEKKAIECKFSRKMILADSSQVSSEDTNEMDFDHVRYSILKSNILKKSFLLKNPNTKSYENLVKYLQNYNSFREILKNDNIVIIEPVKREFNKCYGTSSKPSTNLKKKFFYQPICVNKEINEQELPEPDTVRNVRKLFENGNENVNNSFQKFHEFKSSSSGSVAYNWDSFSISSEFSCSADSNLSYKLDSSHNNVNDKAEEKLKKGNDNGRSRFKV